MTEIKQNCEYKMENVLSVRNKMTQQEIQQTLIDMGNTLNTLGAKKNGPLVTTTLGVEQTAEGPVLDMEILIPLDKEVDVPPPYIFKKLFHLKYAVYARHEGNPQLLQKTLNEMMKYIQENKLTQITSVYSVNIKELKQKVAHKKNVRLKQNNQKLVTDIGKYDYSFLCRIFLSKKGNFYA